MLADRRRRLVDHAFLVARRFSSDRSNRGNSSSSPITSGCRTRSASSRSSWPVWSPSSTTIVHVAFYGGRITVRVSGVRTRAWHARGSATPRLEEPRLSLLRRQWVVRSPIPASSSGSTRCGSRRPGATSGSRPRAGAKLQAAGLDRAGRQQYLYSAAFRAQQEQAKYDKLVRFGERLPTIRTAMAEDMDREHLDRERVCAIALRLINLGWFRPGSERYAKESRTYGITTLRKRHVTVRGKQDHAQLSRQAQGVGRTAVLDAELADALKELIALPAGVGSSAIAAKTASS